RQFRETFDIPIVAITGSNGKTTTKEFVQAVLGAERRAYATQGNLNNHIGVPLTLLAMPRDTEIAVIEMGANKPGDIAELVNIALPTHGVITNIGQAHLEGMGGIRGVQSTKGELFDFLRAHEGIAFVNEGDPMVSEIAQGIAEQVGYGNPESPYHIIRTQAHDDGQMIVLMARGQNLQIRIHLQGRHNADNALLAVAVGQHFGISDEGIQTALAGYLPRMNRSQLHRQGDRSILLDAYNANPSSMKATIASIAAQDHPSVALVLGDMFELGPGAGDLHAEIWDFARTSIPHALIIGIGSNFHARCPKADERVRSYASIADAQLHIQQDLEGYQFILLKGSRGMALERLLPTIGVNL
ncbi:MAG TPA: UDP-N-acetylmuramoyl-tripeptide--D-alanyl-D-alanine ligase, partial [Bacteroidia bacterium]|nr:UDP-N-acetylmuramoyl-tripeptide--D-alanyl-D-alanine ligase [Bacteroidia bacterium]